MGRRSIALALMVLFLGASALTAEATTHTSFSASSYNETDDKSNVISKDPAETTTTLLPTENSTTTTETTEYTTGNHPDKDPDEFTYNKVDGRYKLGYYADSSYAGAVQKTTTTPPDGVSFVSEEGDFADRYEQGSYPELDNQPDEFTVDNGERYKFGYHPESTYAGAAHKFTTTTTDGDSLVSQDSNQEANALQGDLPHRYEGGYYPDSEYSQQTSLYHQQESSGQFSTMPYPSSGVPFMPSGAGCGSAYWVEHTHMWPSFFTVESTVGDALGAQATETFGRTTILQGLMKSGTDPFDELLRTALTSLLNSYCRGAFEIPHIKVIALFIAALVSPEAAKAQASSFETENLESISAGAACT